jgi:hypothetical protein
VKRTAIAALAVVLSCTLAACGGNPNTPDGSTVNSPGSSATPPPQLIKASLTVTVPHRTLQKRGPRYVSSKTQSVVVALASVDGTGISSGTATTLDVSLHDPGCKGTADAIVCRGSVDAASGADVFNVTTFAGPNATGPVLSAGSIASAVSGSSGTVAVSPVSIAIDGVPASLKISATPAFATVGKAGSATILLTAYDGAGAAIAGPSDYFSALSLSIQGDGPGAFQLHSGTASGSTISVVKPSQPIALLYNGNATATSISLQATVPGGGNSSANAAFTLRGTVPPPVAGEIYALNAGANGGLGATVTVYDAKAEGNAAPMRTLKLDPKRYAQSIALDAQGRLYVGYFDSPSGVNVANGSPDEGNDIAVFAAGASGAAQPAATIVADAKSGSALYPASIALDAAGELVTFGATHVDGNGGNDAALIYAAGATGAVAPAAAWGFNSPYFYFPGPQSVALDTAGNFYVAGALKSSLAPQSGVFVAPADDRSKPSVSATRVLPWDAATLLTPGQAGQIGLDATGEIYVANFSRISTGGCQALVNAYAAGAAGGTTDTPPLRSATIASFATTTTSCEQPGNLLAQHFPAIALFGGLVFASDDFNDAIAVYSSGSAGSVTPAQRIAGSATALDAPIALAVAASPTPTLSARDTHARFSSQDAPR